MTSQPTDGRHSKDRELTQQLGHEVLNINLRDHSIESGTMHRNTSQESARDKFLQAQKLK